MNGFLHYFLSYLDPTMNLGFSRAMSVLMSSELPAWWLTLFFSVVVFLVPPIVIWLVYLVKPSLINPPLPARPGQAEPLVSVVIAGRNESPTIRECIRSALLCGYSNLEVVFVDDNSDDNCLALARRAALSVTGSRRDTDRIRIFPSPRRNGKASSLDIAIRMARGEFIAIVDADSIIQYGAIQHLLQQFADPRVGGVAAHIRVNNSTVNLLTRLQEIEYATKYALDRFVATRLNIVYVISGMGGMFRADILHRLGGFDTGLGDDTDLTTMIRKQRWKLALATRAMIWTTAPTTRAHLWSQRMRWRRNTMKIRLSKHRDMFVLGRYGPANAWLVMSLFARIVLTTSALIGLFLAVFENGPEWGPAIVVNFYWIVVIIYLIRMLIAREISGTPQPVNFWLVFLVPYYYVWLLIPVEYATITELFRIGTHHPYVPDHVWEEIPWW